MKTRIAQYSTTCVNSRGSEDWRSIHIAFGYDYKEYIVKHLKIGLYSIIKGHEKIIVTDEHVCLGNQSCFSYFALDSLNKMN